MSPSAIIDGNAVEVRDGDTILDAARRRGIDVPTLCHHAGLAPEGGCRICLVEVEGDERPHGACHTPLAAGMSVRTASAGLESLRREILGLVSSEHAEGRFEANERGGEFERLLAAVRFSQVAFRPRGERGEVDASHPYLRFDATRCITCRRCLHACAEIQGQFVYAIAGRGGDSQSSSVPANASPRAPARRAAPAWTTARPVRSAIAIAKRGSGGYRGRQVVGRGHGFGLRLLRRRLPRADREQASARAPDPRRAGRVGEPRSSLCEGPLRARVAEPSRASDDSRCCVRMERCEPVSWNRRGHLARPALARDSRTPRAGRARRADVVALDERGRVPAAEALPYGDRHQQRRLLRARLPFVDRDGAAAT